MIEYIQSSHEMLCIIVTQLHPFTAGIDSLEIDNEQEMDSLPAELEVGCFLFEGKLMGLVDARESIT